MKPGVAKTPGGASKKSVGFVRGGGGNSAPASDAGSAHRRAGGSGAAQDTSTLPEAKRAEVMNDPRFAANPAGDCEPYNRAGLNMAEMMQEFEALKKEDPNVVPEALKAADEMRNVPLDELDELTVPSLKSSRAGLVGRRAPPNPFHSPMLGRLQTKKKPLEGKSKVQDPALEHNPLRGKLIVTISVNAALLMLFFQSLVVNRILTGVFYAPLKTNWNMGAAPLTLYNMGGLNANAVRQGETVRLFWSMWMHSGWVHILLNVACQIQFFYMLEPDWGIVRTFLTFLVSGITGNLVSAIMDPCKTTVGSSGGLFGLMGAIVPYCIEFWHSIPRPLWILIFSLGCTVVTLATGLTSSTDTWAHAGGFIGGLLFGFGTITTPAAFRPKERVLKKQVRKNPYMRWFQQAINPECKCGIREWTIRLVAWLVFFGIWLSTCLLLFENYEYNPPGSITYSGITKCCCCYMTKPGGSQRRRDWACDSCDAKVFTTSDMTWHQWCEYRAAAPEQLNRGASRSLLALDDGAPLGGAGSAGGEGWNVPTYDMASGGFLSPGAPLGGAQVDGAAGSGGRNRSHKPALTRIENKGDVALTELVAAIVANNP